MLGELTMLDFELLKIYFLTNCKKMYHTYVICE